VKEGLEMTKAVRDRYDGQRRNPWNEIECGSNYARSMASYAVLTALGGFEYDMTRGMIGFDPKLVKRNTFRTFWSLDPAWGTFEMKGKKIDLVIKTGSLNLKEFRLPFLKKDKIKAVKCGAKTLDFKFTKGGIVFKETVQVSSKLAVILK
jgi:hypothetical protein